MTDNITWHKNNITKEDRCRLKKHKPVCLWFTGLSGSGKSTLANIIETKLFEMGIHTYLLDGDNIRHGLNKDLGFTDEEREENIRRIGEVAKLFVDAGIIVLTAFISPFKKDRDAVRFLLNKDEFIEIFVDCDLEVCKSRDPKGLYKKAELNEISHFTGIDSPYEAPENPELKLYNDDSTHAEDNAAIIINYLLQKEIITQ